MAKQNTSSSSRSKNTIIRVQPALEKAFEKKGLSFGTPVYLRIFKQEMALEVWVQNRDHFALFKSYPICTYAEGSGPKQQEGDGKAPEGFYFVKPNQLNPLSSYHLSFNLGYPNLYDRSHSRTGSTLMVHGNCVSIGCYAMTDEKIEEIYTIADAALNQGQSFYRVHIFPFRMTPENMRLYKDSQWYSYWQNLKQGYDFFEIQGFVPPNVEVEQDKYIFN